MITVEIPEGIEASLSGNTIKLKGKQGEVEREFRGTPVELKLEGNKLTVSAKGRAMEGTVRAHVQLMAKGVTDGFEKKLIIKYAHFPITIEVKGKEVLIKNFLGEKSPRRSAIQGNCKVQVKGQEISVTGPCKEDVGQTAANIRETTKVRKKDIRIFQDGIYVER